MLGHWYNLDLPPFSTLSAWGIIAIVSIAAVVISFWIAALLERR